MLKAKLKKIYSSNLVEDKEQNRNAIINRSKILIATNILTSLILLFLVYKEGYAKSVYSYFFDKKQQESTTYSLNPQFIEQADYCSIFNAKANIVMLGNSLTYRMNWDELLERSDVVNRGVGSDITSGFVDRLKYVFSANPKICFIEGGINDIDRNIEDSIIIKNLEIIINELKKHSIIPVLTTVTHVSKNYTNYGVTNQKIALLNQSYSQLASKLKVKTLDLNQFVSLNKTLQNNFAEKDGIHLKSDAYLIWKDEILKILTDLKI